MSLADEINDSELYLSTAECLWSDSDWKNLRLGRYKLLDLLGKGGMGRVFLARDMILQRDIAVKAISETFTEARDSGKLKQFLREAQAVARLEHPHVVRVYDLITEDGVIAIAMEYVSNSDLQHLVKNSGKLPVITACDYVAQAAEGLAHAHKKGVVHRDIKPGNLMLTDEDICKVVDFGAAAMEEKAELEQHEGKAIGTPYYIPPELAKGNPPTPASDIYSLGAVLWFALTAQPPFKGKSVKELHMKHCRERLSDIRKLRPEIPRVLKEAIDKALAKDPTERFSSMNEFATVLREFISAEAAKKAAPINEGLQELTAAINNAQKNNAEAIVLQKSASRSLAARNTAKAQATKASREPIKKLKAADYKKRGRKDAIDYVSVPPKPGLALWIKILIIAMLAVIMFLAIRFINQNNNSSSSINTHTGRTIQGSPNTNDDEYVNLDLEE